MKINWASYLTQFRSYQPWKTRLLKCINGLVSENPTVVNVLTSPQNSWNLQKSTVILLFNHFSQTESKKSFLIRFETLELVVNRLSTIDEYFRNIRENLPPPIERQLSKKSINNILMFYCIFGMYIKFGTLWKSIEPLTSPSFVVINLERRDYLNA